MLLLQCYFEEREGERERGEVSGAMQGQPAHVLFHNMWACYQANLITLEFKHL